MAVSLLTALALQLLPAPGATQWEAVANDPEGRTWLDPASIARDGARVRLVTKTEFSQADTDGMRVLVVRLQINCQRREFGLEAGDSYTSDGRFLESRDAASSGGLHLRPMDVQGSQATLYRRACGAAQ